MNHRPEEASQWHQLRRRRRRRGCAALLLTPVVIIGLLFAWFGIRLLAKPTVSRDYLAELNAARAEVPEQDRAWPLYKQAVLFKLDHPMPDELLNNWPIYPGWNQWDEAKAWLTETKPALDLIRAGAKKPALGKPLLTVQDEDIARAEAARDGRPFVPEVPEEKPMLMMVLLPELGYLRTGARDLAPDTFLAMEQGDKERAIENIEASLRMADHAAESQTIIGQLVQVAIEHLAARTALTIIDAYPGAFDEADLERLQTAFMTIGREGMPAEGGLTRLTIDISLERISFYDVVQRTYSDDGNGDGHMTVEGLKLLNTVVSISGAGVRQSLVDLPMVLLAASRRDLLSKYDEMMDRLEANAALWPWERDKSISLDAEVEAMHANALTRSRYLLLSILLPALEKAVTTLDQANARRDATIAALALHRWHAEHGSFPESLDALVPAYLPRLPLDPVDGKPLRYAITPDGPVLYSLGADGDDDGGARLGEEHKVMPPHSDMTDGDWILYPIPAVEEPVDE